MTTTTITTSTTGLVRIVVESQELLEKLGEEAEAGPPICEEVNACVWGLEAVWG